MRRFSRPIHSIAGGLILALLAPLAHAEAPAKAATRPAAVAAATTRPATTRPATTRPAKPLAATRPTNPVKAQPETVADLRALEAQVESVVANVAPAVVGIRSGGGQGSGVIITEDGYVLTAGHVSGMTGRDVTLLLVDGKTVKGKTLGINFAVDSGLIKITDPAPTPDGKWPFVEMGRSGQLKKGDWCVTLGHPGGYKTGRTPPVRLGRILDTRGTFLRTDCTLVGGDSGGPLFDFDGKVIGIHSRIGTTLNENMHVPVDTFRDTWARLAAGESWGATFMGFNAGGGAKPGGPYMGLKTDPEVGDCKITEVFPDSPAAKAGLQTGDVVTSLAGKKVESFAQLLVALNGRKAGDEITIEVTRDNKPVTLKMTLGKRPGPG